MPGKVLSSPQILRCPNVVYFEVFLWYEQSG
jgi:hypothetical protein